MCLCVCVGGEGGADVGVEAEMRFYDPEKK